MVQGTKELMTEINKILKTLNILHLKLALVQKKNNHLYLKVIFSPHFDATQNQRTGIYYS
jgi:hypothetical protein